MSQKRAEKKNGRKRHLAVTPTNQISFNFNKLFSKLLPKTTGKNFEFLLLLFSSTII